ncbi:MAG: TonB-dependent receptor [Pseudomonadota bacterium]
MNRCSFGVAAICAAMVIGTAGAQEFEEIVVTAQKREQSLQDVPIAVSAFGSSALEKAGVQDLRDLMALSPSLVLSSSASEAAGTVARIRGVGTTGDNAGLESSVAVFIDGVYRNRNNVGMSDLGEVERIEVLRGPQGTLFGKNASAGLIHVITKGPDFEEGYGYVKGGVGDFSAYNFGAGWTGPIGNGDTAAFRIDAGVRARDGFIEELNSGEEYNDRDRYNVRAQLALAPNETFDARIIADYSSREETCCAAVTIVNGPTGGIIGALGGSVITPADPFNRVTTTNTNRGFQQDVDEYGISAELNFEFETTSLTTITSYRDWETNRSQDVDYTDADILYRDTDGYVQGFNTLTQEIRLQGGSDTFEWMVGGYYADEELTLSDAVRVGDDYELFADFLLGGPGVFGVLVPQLPPGSVYPSGAGVIEDSFQQDTTSLAVFTHNTFHIGDDFHLTVGVRYTNEEKELNASLQANNPACLTALGNLQMGAPIPPEALGLICLPFFSPLVDGTYSGERTDNEVSGTINFAYDFADDWMGYFSYGHGFKAGGFNVDRAGLSNPLLGGVPTSSDLEFRKETVDSFELGVKGRAGATSIALAAFHSEFEDFQLNTFTGIAFIVENLGEVETTGVELEIGSPIGDNWFYQGGVTYADARYGDNIQSSNPVLAGARLTNAPLWVASSSLTYEADFGSDKLWFAHVDGRYMSDYNTGSDLDVEKIQGGFGVVNFKFGFGAADDSWQIEAFLQNAFDKDYIQIAFDAPLQGSGTGPGSTQQFNAFLAEPRLWGVAARWGF